MTIDAIRQIFCSPGLSWIAERLRARVQRDQSLTGSLTLTNATAEQRSELDSLLGRRPTRGNTLNLGVESLLETLGINDPTQIVQACFGDVENLRAQRDESAAKWNGIVSEAREQFVDDPSGAAWIDSLNDGLLKRLAHSDPAVGRQLLAVALKVWKRMPYNQVTLAELAAKMTGDTHAFDRGQPLSPLLLRGLKFRTGHDGPKSAELRRQAWDAVGVVIDRISAPALTFNLWSSPATDVEGILKGFRSLIQPVYLTYQFLSVDNPFLPLPLEMKRVFVVENPVVVEVAAAQLGPRCAPLICSEGQPASAVKKLLGLLSRAGAEINLHADFDWRGLSFVDQLLGIAGTVPWRMDVETYRAASGTVPLSGQSFEPGWANALSTAMKKYGTAVYEEQILPQLLEDLSF